MLTGIVVHREDAVGLAAIPGSSTFALRVCFFLFASVVWLAGLPALCGADLVIDKICWPGHNGAGVEQGKNRNCLPGNVHQVCIESY